MSAPAAATGTVPDWVTPSSGWDEVTIGSRRVSGALSAPSTMALLRWSLYSTASLTAGTVNTTIANWATTNYGTP